MFGLWCCGKIYLVPEFDHGSYTSYTSCRFSDMTSVDVYIKKFIEKTNLQLSQTDEDRVRNCIHKIKEQNNSKRVNCPIIFFFVLFFFDKNEDVQNK